MELVNRLYKIAKEFDALGEHEYAEIVYKWAHQASQQLKEPS